MIKKTHVLILILILINTQCISENKQYNTCVMRNNMSTKSTACMERNVTDGDRSPNMAICLVPVVCSHHDFSTDDVFKGSVLPNHNTSPLIVVF